MVVIEKRKTYCLLITAFYIEREHTLQKKLKNIINIKRIQQKAPHYVKRLQELLLHLVDELIIL